MSDDDQNESAPAQDLIITVRDVAALLGLPLDKQRRKMSMQKARRFLIKSGAARKFGTRWITTRDKLRDHFPEVWEKIVMDLISCD